ncbi:hypothetical protein IFM89_020950, partial [Coptis chinensis]
MVRYTDSTELGFGGYGTVFSAYDNKEGKWVAIKKVNMEMNVITAAFTRETFLMQNIRHPNIVRCENVFVEGESLCIVMELLNMDLQAHSSKFNSAYPAIVKIFLKHLLEGLAHMHGKFIIHRDLKTTNLLVDTDSTPPTLKITDFGHAAIALNPTLSPKMGTMAYNAPEFLLGAVDYGMPVDIWAAGCIFGEMSEWGADEEGSMVFGKDAETDVDLLFDIFGLLGAPTEASWPGVTELPKWINGMESLGFAPKDLNARFLKLDGVGIDLLKRMLCLNPSERITAEAALKHEYFNGAQSMQLKLGSLQSTLFSLSVTAATCFYCSV